MAEFPSRKIRLFAHRSQEPSTSPIFCFFFFLEFKGDTVHLVFREAPSQLLAGRETHAGLILEQYAKIVRDASYDRMLSQIDILHEITDWGAWTASQDAKAETQRVKAEHDHLRRERIDARCRTAFKKAQQGRLPPPPRPKIRLIPKSGRREAREVPLTEDDLYLNNARPDIIRFPLMHHICILCNNVKSHPVS